MTPAQARESLAALGTPPPAYSVAARHAYESAAFTAACWLAADGCGFRVGRLAVQVRSGGDELERPAPSVPGLGRVRWG